MTSKPRAQLIVQSRGVTISQCYLSVPGLEELGAAPCRGLPFGFKLLMAVTVHTDRVYLIFSGRFFCHKDFRRITFF